MADKVCPNCGYLMEENDTQCLECGCSIEEEYDLENENQEFYDEDY